jgi:hypothetical protein
MMRVFVTGTGRCGTSTFYHACKHITNYTCGHETKTGPKRICDLEYPDNHIEVSSHLALFIPLLRQRYPDALWVHLIREKNACVKSLASQSSDNLERWSLNWFEAAPAKSELPEVAELYYHTINSLIQASLTESRLGVEAPPRLIPVVLKEGESSSVKFWDIFWGQAGCQGDYAASLAEWNRAYNHHSSRGRNRYVVLK